MEILLGIINQIKANKGEKPLDEISLDMNLRNDLELDSFDLALMTALIEDEFDIDVFEDGIVNTISEIVEKLEK